MANYQQNGQPYYGHQNHPSQSQQNHQYSAYSSQLPSQNHTLHSTPSFDNDDDVSAHNHSQGYQNAGDSTLHMGTNNAVAQNNIYPSSVTHQTLPVRTSSQTAGYAGYPQQYHVPTTNQPTYNPQQFTQAQQQYTTQGSYSPAQNYSHSSSFQTYNPAAYQPATAQRQTAYGAQSAYSAQASYVNAQAPPPPPPRPHDQPHIVRHTSYSNNHPNDNTSTFAPTPPSHPGSAPLPPLPSPYSSPPPPPPPRHDSFNQGRSNISRPHLRDSQNSSAGSFHSSLVQSPEDDYAIPPIYNTGDPRSFGSRMNSRSSEHHSSPPIHTPPSSRYTSQAPPQRTESLNHPHQRPLPGLPTDSESDSDYFGLRNGTRAASGQHEELGYDDLMREVEAAVNQGRPSSSDVRTNPRLSRSSRQTTFRDGDPDSTSTATPVQSILVPDEQPSHTNTTFTPTGSGSYVNYGAFSEDSDAEASYGLAAMQADEERDAAEARRRSGSTSLFSSQGSQRQPRLPLPPMQDVSSDSDYGNIDMGLVGGGYEAHMHYGDDPNADAAAGAPPPGYTPGSRIDSIRSSDRSSAGRSSQASAYDGMPSQEAIHPFPPFKHHDVARVDTSGTGGLTEPSPHPRRMSFEDGDEATLVDSEFGQPSDSQSPSKDSMADLFFHPGLSPQRPLPPPPIDTTNRLPHLIPAGTYRHPQYDTPGRYAPDQYESMMNQSAVPRSTSDVSQRRIPRTDQPIRAKTDAERQKVLKQQSMSGSTSYDSSGTQSAVPLDLPALPKKKFNPKKIGAEQFKKCAEPWALTSILAWIKEMAQDETDLRENAIVEGIVALFVHKVPTMNTADAETLGAKVVKDMFKAGALITEEEWVKFGTETMSGVLFQLTGTGCYSPKLHVYETPGRCYSYHCMRTLRKVDLSQLMEPEKKTEDWVTFYKMTKDKAESRGKKELERQNVIHEIVTSEDYYMSSLNVLRILYRDSLARTQPPIISGKRLNDFMKEVFGQIDVVKKVNEDYLLAQLKYRQKEQGPWIVGFSDIFREWIRKAKSVYVDYAAAFPRADYLVRQEAERNLLFQQFLNQAREDKRSNRLSWDTYLKSPITRLQRYGLLLQTVHKQMVKDSEEKTNLQFAIDEVRAATFECNAKLDEQEKKMHLLGLQQKLRLRKGMDVELNLNHLGREILIQGDLLRAGGKGLQWVETHAILFDNYLVLAKAVHQRDSAGGVKNEVYDVSKVPIPMDLIVIESTNDAPVVKSSLKGMGAITSTVGPRGANADPRLARTTSTPTSGAGPGTLQHRDTASGLSEKSSGKSMVTTTVLDTPDEKIMYPFKVKHLGRNESYILYAPTAGNRQDWCEALITAKTEHAQALFEQNAEPFRLRVLADTAFGYDAFSASQKTVVIKGTPLDRAIKETEKAFKDQQRPGPVCRASVNCATVFNQPYGRLMMAVGTDYGVFTSDYSNSRGWKRSIQITKVTQVYVFEEFNLFLVIADKSLIAYPLDLVCPVPGSTAPDSARRAPQKLSGSREVNFFATGRMKDRALVIYKKKEGMSSTFKVLEPILQKSTTSRSRFLPSSTRRGHTDFFRDYDEFYVPTECYGVNLFHTSLAVSTARGVEVLTLDKKQPHSVPNKYSDQPDAQATLSSIHNQIANLKPLGMFRLSDAEFLVCYDECAVYVNKHGDVSRGVVMEFVGKARTACLYGQYLILLDDDFVEIRNAANGRLKQVIAGKDIKLLDDGGGGNGTANHPQFSNGPAQLGGGVNGLGMRGYGAAPRTVKICMQHPEVERCMVLVELVENEARKDTLP